MSLVSPASARSVSTATEAPIAAALAVAVVWGALLAVVDLAWNAVAPSVWATVANSCAGWAAAAYLLGVVLRVRPVVAALAGVVMLVVAVEAYYVAGAAVLGWSQELVGAPSTVLWLELAVGVGATLGAAGAWAARGGWLAAGLGTAACAAVFLGEALYVGLWEPASAAGGTASALGVLGLVVLAASVRRPAVAAWATVVTLPAAVVVAGGFVVAGVGL